MDSNLLIAILLVIISGTKIALILFIRLLLKMVNRRDQVIFTMTKQDYSPDMGVVSDMLLDDLKHEEKEEDEKEDGKRKDDLIDISEMTPEDLAKT
jgi:hypothetical protein